MYPHSPHPCGWSVIPYTKRLKVQFPARAHTHVTGSIPAQLRMRRHPIDFSLTSMSLSLSPLSLSPFSFSQSNEKMSLGEDKKIIYIQIKTVHSNFIYNSQKLEQTKRPPIGECITNGH